MNELEKTLREFGLDDELKIRRLNRLGRVHSTSLIEDTLSINYMSGKGVEVIRMSCNQLHPATKEVIGQSYGYQIVYCQRGCLIGRDSKKPSSMQYDKDNSHL
jgi:hypothetical protein